MARARKPRRVEPLNGGRVMRSAGLHRLLEVEPGPPPEEVTGVRGSLVGEDGLVIAYVDGFDPAQLEPGQRIEHVSQAQPGEPVEAAGAAAEEDR